jgi:hypothetical protein
VAARYQRHLSQLPPAPLELRQCRPITGGVNARGARAASANKYVACTDKLRADTPRRAGAKGGNVVFVWKVVEGESSKRRRGLKSGQ